MGDTFIGEIKAFAGTYVPQGWIECDGRQLTIRDFQILFALIGTQFGGNAAQGTFNLPDLRSHVVVGAGQGVGLSPWQVNQKAGTEMVTLTQAQTPVHTHSVYTQYGKYSKYIAAFSETTTDSNSYPSRYVVDHGTGTDTYTAYAASSDVQMNSGVIANYAGQGQAHENRQPFLALIFAINATAGLYPPFN